MLVLDEEEKAEEVVLEEGAMQPDDDHEEIVVEEDDTKPKGKKQSKNKKPNKLKGAFSELKKVTWPSFNRVVKETLVVLSVTLVFLVVIFGIDQLLSLFYNFLTKSIGE
ncbi:MAG: preprotein translocase subunit SecE [Clostridia bacterium]|nr:preprotein translocase subunit SecE [Clostridia bacterium]